MALLLISRTETEAKIKEANQTKATIDETQIEVSRTDQYAQKTLSDALPMMERVDDIVERLIKINTLTSGKSTLHQLWVWRLLNACVYLATKMKTIWSHDRVSTV